MLLTCANFVSFVVILTPLVLSNKHVVVVLCNPGQTPARVPSNTLFLIPDEFFETARIVWNTGVAGKALFDTTITFQAPGAPQFLITASILMDCTVAKRGRLSDVYDPEEEEESPQAKRQKKGSFALPFLRISTHTSCIRA